MIDKQPESLRLADALDSMTTENIRFDQLDEAAAELRRLHEVNAELVRTLKAIKVAFEKEDDRGAINDTLWVSDYETLFDFIDTAIAKATGEQQ